MTTCIAAVCLDPESLEHKLILCADTDLTDNYTQIRSYQAFRKIVPLGHGWHGMIAGGISTALRLVAQYPEQLGAILSGATMSNICSRLSKPSLDLLGTMADELSVSLGSRPQPMVFDCEMIVAGFLGSEPVIVHIGNNGVASLCDAWVTIGCGSALATPSLSIRDCQRHFFLNDMIYFVYEAKKRSERVIGVGDNTVLMLVSRESETRFSPEAITFLDSLYWKYNPEPQFEVPPIPKEYSF